LRNCCLPAPCQIGAGMLQRRHLGRQHPGGRTCRHRCPLRPRLPPVRPTHAATLAAVKDFPSHHSWHNMCPDSDRLALLRHGVTDVRCCTLLGAYLTCKGPHCLVGQDVKPIHVLSCAGYNQPCTPLPTPILAEAPRGSCTSLHDCRQLGRH
jgi:hypothetical protein